MFWIVWTAPTGMGSDYEPWQTLLSQSGINCHFFRQDKVTQIDCILIIWRWKEVLQMSLMDLILLSLAAKGHNSPLRCHPRSLY